MLRTADEFAKALIGSGLFSKEEVEEFCQSLASDPPTNAERFAELLTVREKLTSFQAQEILQERSTPLILDDYVVLERLGRGGMGEVYKARHRCMDRIVAIKVIGRWLSSEAIIKRFQREVKAAAKLLHSNIVVTYDAGESRGHHYLVMELVDGANLHEFAKECLTPGQAIGFILQATTGLEYAHKEGVIHRDIKPANLMVDKNGRLRILDMGIARIDQPLAEDGLTRPGDFLGTVDYMAPEQWSGPGNVDGRCDIYSLGCTLFQLCTGKLMYPGRTALDIAHRHACDPIPSLRDYCPAATPELDSVFRRMVAKKPQDRFPTMTAVRDALISVQQQYADHESAPGPSPPWLRVLNNFWGASSPQAKAKMARPRLMPSESVSSIVVDTQNDEDSGKGVARRFGTLAPTDGRRETVDTDHAAGESVVEQRLRAGDRITGDFGSKLRVRFLLVSVALVLILLFGLIANWRPLSHERSPFVAANPTPTLTPPETTPAQPEASPTKSDAPRPENLKPLNEATPQTPTQLAWKLLYSGKYVEAEREATRVLSESKSLSAHICRARARQQIETDNLEPAESDVAAVMAVCDQDRQRLPETEQLELYRVAGELKELRGDRAVRKSDLPEARNLYSEAIRLYERALEIRPQHDTLQETCNDVKGKLNGLTQF